MRSSTLDRPSTPASAATNTSKYSTDTRGHSRHCSSRRNHPLAHCAHRKPSYPDAHRDALPADSLPRHASAGTHRSMRRDIGSAAKKPGSTDGTTDTPSHSPPSGHAAHSLVAFDGSASSMPAAHTHSDSDTDPTRRVSRLHGHAAHDDMPHDDANVSRGHAAHSPSPDDDVNVPGAHASHAAMPRRDVLPAAHATHDSWSADGACPAAHVSLHRLPSADTTWPAAHAPHRVELAANSPGPHDTHADMPADAAMCRAGHATHVALLLAPDSRLWLPAGHGLHVALLLAPVASDQLPAGHRAHSSGDVALTSGPNVPGGHRMHCSALAAPSDG